MEITKKELMQKIPFGKKTATDENGVETENATSENTVKTSVAEAAGAAGEKMKLGLSGAKDMVSGFAGKVKNDIDNATQKPATKACPQCGGMVKETGKFCGKCGYRF